MPGLNAGAGYVCDVRSHITIYFRDGSSVTLYSGSNNQNVINNYCSSINIKESLFKQSSNSIVGNITGNSCNLKIISINKELIPQNINSSHYGLMDDTAYIDISLDYKIKYIDDIDTTVSKTDISLGRWYVQSWEGGTDSNKSNEITIVAVDRLSKIKNIPLSRIKLQEKINAKSYLVYIKNIINNKLPSPLKLDISDDKIDMFNNTNDYNLILNNIDRDSVEDMFNNIAENTLTWIWVDRAGCLCTDWLLDEYSQEPVAVFDGSKNIFSYNSNVGSVSKYRGVQVEYITGISYTSEKVLNISGASFNANENILNNVTMSKDNVLTIDTISVNNKDIEVEVLAWYKNSIDLVVRNESQYYSDIAIDVFGIVVNEHYSTVTAYLTNDNTYTDTGNILKIRNRILRRENINDYVRGLIKLLRCKSTMVSCTGPIDPDIKLDDCINVIGSKLGVNDTDTIPHKVTGINISLKSGGNYSATYDLMQVITDSRQADDIIYSNITYLYNACYNFIDPDLRVLTPAEEEVVMEAYGNDLEELYDACVGGELR